MVILIRNEIVAVMTVFGGWLAVAKLRMWMCKSQKLGIAVTTVFGEWLLLH
jgi:hypothetical protein